MTGPGASSDIFLQTPWRGLGPALMAPGPLCPWQQPPSPWRLSPFLDLAPQSSLGRAWGQAEVVGWGRLRRPALYFWMCVGGVAESLLSPWHSFSLPPSYRTPISFSSPSILHTALCLQGSQSLDWLGMGEGKCLGSRTLQKTALVAGLIGLYSQGC